MNDLMSKGMRYANQALLFGCSAGGLASILNCDEFRRYFPRRTRVKCLSDAGLFLDAVDVSGSCTLRNKYGRVGSLQGVKNDLPRVCTNHLDPTSVIPPYVVLLLLKARKHALIMQFTIFCDVVLVQCFFPQNTSGNVKMPLFVLNAAFHSWQIQSSLGPPTADPHGCWSECRKNHARCSADFCKDSEIKCCMLYLDFSKSRQNGLLINSCFAHCLS